MYLKCCLAVHLPPWNIIIFINLLIVLRMLRTKVTWIYLHYLVIVTLKQNQALVRLKPVLIILQMMVRELQRSQNFIAHLFYFHLTIYLDSDDYILNCTVRYLLTLVTFAKKNLKYGLILSYSPRY